jgi:Ca2+-binding EF-hand superfamily protein
LALVALLVLGWVGMNATWAGDEEGGDKPERRKQPKMDRKAFMEKFDADGDGKLSEEEKAAAKAAMDAKREEMRLKRFDKDGDGVLSEEEKAAAEAAKAKMIAEWDKDGDGKLSKEEHMMMRKAMRERQKERAGKRGEGGKRKRKGGGEGEGGAGIEIEE